MSHKEQINTKAQVIFDNGKPAFIVLRYQDYQFLTADSEFDNNEFVPFIMSDYIKNPLRIMRIEAGFTQKQLAKLMKLTQGYISRMEARGTHVPESLLNKAKVIISRHSNKRKVRKK
jgi:DNA-binding XRE family transcriptional regulator